MWLLRDRDFNIAILVSAACHFIFMFSVSPVLMPVEVKTDLAEVFFLGSIMGRLIAVPERSLSLDRVSFMQKIEMRKEITPEQVSLTPPQAISKVLDVTSDKERFSTLADKHETMTFKVRFKKKESPRITPKTDAITGGAINRLVLYKPDLSRSAIFPFYFSSNYNISIRVRISRHGFVERPECILSSGSFEIDQMAIRYIRRWQFVPHDGDLQDVQEGIIRVSF